VKTARRSLGPLAAVAAPLLAAAPVFAGPRLQPVPPHGTVVALDGTPHIWVADEQGALHWGGDTRALSGRFVNWSDRRAVSLSQLRGYRIGDPWLSAGLLKIGDPIYLVKWEVGQERPSLLRIQAIRDVEVFGINGSNYGAFVLDQATWEQRYGMGAGPLPRGELPPTETPTPGAPGPTVTPTRSTPRVREARVIKIPNGPVPSFETVVEVENAPLDQRLTVRLEYEEYICNPGCTSGSSSRKDRWGPRDAGPVDANGRLTYRDRHGPYRAYTYTFEEPGGFRFSKEFGDDLSL
jgi:hypothetical protein